MCYIYLLCAVFREGYAIKYDDDLVCALSLDVGVPEEKVKELVAFFADRGLVDADVLSKYNVLTSHGIQKRFQEIVRSRARTRKVTVVENLWILCGEETEDFVIVSDTESFFGNNGVFTCKNSINTCKNSVLTCNNPQIKEKKIKEKEIKENERVIPTASDSPRDTDSERKSYGSYNNVWLNDAEFEKLHTMYGDADAKIERLSSYMMTSGKNYASHYATIVHWAKEDAEKVRAESEFSGSSFDTEEIWEAALKRSYGDDYREAMRVYEKSVGGNN